MNGMNHFSNLADTQTLTHVGLLGFETLDQGRLKKIFEQPHAGGRQYVATLPAKGEHFDILLVNFDSSAAVAHQNALLQDAPATPVAAVSRGPLSDAPAYHLRGMLIAAKVFGLLDKIPLADSRNVAAARPQLTLVPPPAPPVVEAQPAIGYRALVVDDSIAIQKSLELNLSQLEQIGGIDFADNGEEALEKARNSHYDLIFLDVMMPGIDGYETCAQLRKIAQYKKTPIIMVSGKASPLDEVKGVIAGCTTYLTKPVQKEAFQKLSLRVLTWLDNFRIPNK